MPMHTHRNAPSVPVSDTTGINYRDTRFVRLESDEPAPSLVKGVSKCVCYLVKVPGRKQKLLKPSFL